MKLCRLVTTRAIIYISYEDLLIASISAPDVAINNNPNGSL
jgi:hypothetical protein